MDLYLYASLCTQISSFTLRCMQAIHALTTAGKGFVRRANLAVDSRVVCVARRCALMTCCFVLRHFGVPDVTGGSQVRCYELRQMDGRIVTAVRVIYALCGGKNIALDGRAMAGRRQGPKHPFHKPEFSASQSVW